jgi:hypothetical protein
MLGATRAFGYALKVGRHPASIETAGLRDCAIPSNTAFFHQTRVEGQISGDRREPLCWILITPRSPCSGRRACDHVEILCSSFPLTKAGPRRRNQRSENIFRRKIVGRCVMGLQNTHRSGGVGNDFASEPHANAMFHRYERWRPRVRLNVLWCQICHVGGLHIAHLATPHGHRIDHGVKFLNV